MFRTIFVMMLVAALATPAWAQSQADKTGVGAESEREYRPFGLTETQLGYSIAAAALVAIGVTLIAGI